MSKQDTTTFNGWSNRSTWIVNLWLNNDESLQIRLQSIIDNNKLNGIEKDEAVKELVDEVVSWQEFNYSETLDGFLLDLINNTLFQVDWTEIVENNR